MARTSRWRRASRIVIEKVMKENPDASKEELRKLLSAAYPFGQRKHHPYKMWLDECRKVLGRPAVRNRSIRHYWTGDNNGRNSDE